MQDRPFRTAWRLPALALAACAVVATLVEARPPLERPPRTAIHPQALRLAVAPPVQFDPPSAAPALAGARRMAPPRHAPAQPPDEAWTPIVLATLSGRVVVSGSSLGVAGAAVELTPQGRGSERRRAVSAGDGSYLLANLEVGTYAIQASRLGYAPLTVVLAIGDERTSQELSLAPIGDGSGSEVLSGQVTDAATRAPIPFARVTVRGQGLLSRTETTDGDGRYRMSNLPSLETRLLVTAGGYRAEEAVVAPAGGETRRDVTLVPESALVATLTGQVLSRSDGSPIAARLAMRPRAGGEAIAGGSDAEGSFRFEALAPGDWLLQVEADGFLATERPMRIQAGQRHEQVLLEPTSGTLQGTVLSRRDQAPIAGATVSLEGGWTGVTDEEGRFEIDQVSTGRRQFHADAEGFGGVSFHLQILGGPQELLVSLDPLAVAECDE